MPMAISFSQANSWEKSFGMMCSPRELLFAKCSAKNGVIELSEDQVVGTPFDPAKHWTAYQEMCVFDRPDRGDKMAKI